MSRDDVHYAFVGWLIASVVLLAWRQRGKGGPPAPISARLARLCLLAAWGAWWVLLAAGAAAACVALPQLLLLVLAALVYFRRRSFG